MIERSARHETHRGVGEGCREERPWNEARVVEDRLRDPGGVSIFKTRSEHEGEDDHEHQRLDDCPCPSEQGLLVAHLDVAPREEEDEVPVAP